ncbi:N-acetyllactosaminide beta-1,3-N-acetylglucosaminyltransferase 2-like isoform X1 [Cololabis saira]|uniref:N-acetyllactosaminide beta-1,3-N-acetylglucosaminyltransferase 2-like isoform X1 n=1 Tax=Cololabis saira TaxID=129043 RepID=UPI002AD30F72|nr:N-acetyllactosaminide beta-1,3-N-acetylglucosaminyltransferase 2-like isoform X1 [Cololabis saira]
MGRAADMAAARGRARTAVVVLMLVLAALLGLLWKLWSSSSRDRVLVPSGRFWRPWPDSRAFWNREQQRLDLLYSPIFHPNGSLGNRSLTPQDPCTADPRVPTQVSDYNTLPRRFQDFLLHMRCRSSRLRISPPRGCGGGNGGGNGAPFLLLAVKSLVPHFARRQAIRETWGRAGVVGGRSVVTLFLLGDASPADHHPALQGMLGEEARLHGDLLQWDYRDSFFNLTLKDVLFLQWFGRRCRRARYVLKGDDDVFVNTPRVLQLLGELDQVHLLIYFIPAAAGRPGPGPDPGPVPGRRDQRRGAAPRPPAQVLRPGERVRGLVPAVRRRRRLPAVGGASAAAAGGVAARGALPHRRRVHGHVPAEAGRGAAARRRLPDLRPGRGAAGKPLRLPEPRVGARLLAAGAHGALALGGAAGPGLPVAGPGLPVAGPGLPVAAPGLPVAGPGLPVATPGLPVATPGLPVATPGLPVAAPGLPVAGPGLPVAAPGLPVAAPGLPVARSRGWLLGLKPQMFFQKPWI